MKNMWGGVREKINIYGGGGSAKKLKYVRVVREKMKISEGGGLRNFPFSPPQDLKWNSPYPGFSLSSNLIFTWILNLKVSFLVGWPTPKKRLIKEVYYFDK